MSPKTHRSGYRVLLVDDHAPYAEAATEFMRGMQLDVRIASNGREALEMAAAFHPEIVLCDLYLPDMLGLDVARALRAIPGVKSAVIAMHTAMTESDLRSLRDADAPVNLFLSKPITEKQIGALISQLPSHARKKKL